MSSVTINGVRINSDLPTSMRTYTLVQEIIRRGDVQTLALRGDVGGEPATIALSITPHTQVSAAWIDSESDVEDNPALTTNLEELSAHYFPKVAG